jgi:RimJ/RimL family protein N-acetyltransferase
MTRADLDPLLPLQREAAQVAFATVFPQDEFPFPTEAIRHRWEQELADPGVECFVIVDEDRSVRGFAAVQGDQFLHFGTALGSWGSGLAGAAHAEVLDHWKAKGYHRGWLRVLEQNLRARRFYVRRGWQPTGDQERSGFAPFPVLLRYEVNLSTPPVGV